MDAPDTRLNLNGPAALPERLPLFRGHVVFLSTKPKICFAPIFKKANLHVGQLAPVSREYRMKVLHGTNQAVAAHILVSLAIKVVGDACDNLLCQASPR